MLTASEALKIVEEGEPKRKAEHEKWLNKQLQEVLDCIRERSNNGNRFMILVDSEIEDKLKELGYTVEQSPDNYQSFCRLVKW